MDIEALFSRCEGAFAQHTLRAYRADYRVYEAWCRQAGVSPDHPQPSQMAQFVDAVAASRASATVRRYLDSLTSMRRLAGLPSVTQHPEVTLALKRMYRRKGHGQVQAVPLTRAVLAELLAVCHNDLMGLRDRLLLTLGYYTMRRRAELCSFRFEDLERRHDGRQALRLRFSKADQWGMGKLLAMAPPLCEMVQEWGERVGARGYLLRGHRTLYNGDVPLSPATINLRLRALQKRSGLSLGGWLSGHSFRVGAALDMLEDGVSMEKIMLRGGWKTESPVMRYLRAWEPS